MLQCTRFNYNPDASTSVHNDVMLPWITHCLIIRSENRQYITLFIIIAQENSLRNINYYQELLFHLCNSLGIFARLIRVRYYIERIDHCKKRKKTSTTYLIFILAHASMKNLCEMPVAKIEKCTKKRDRCQRQNIRFCRARTFRSRILKDKENRFNFPNARTASLSRLSLSFSISLALISLLPLISLSFFRAPSNPVTSLYLSSACLFLPCVLLPSAKLFHFRVVVSAAFPLSFFLSSIHVSPPRLSSSLRFSIWPKPVVDPCSI